MSYKAMADGVGIAPTQPGGSLGFRDRGITTLPTIRNGQGGGSGLPKPCEPVSLDGTVAIATRSAPADGRAQAPRSQTECVATTLRAGYPDGLSRRRGPGGHGNTNLGDVFRGESLADPKGVAP